MTAAALTCGWCPDPAAIVTLTEHAEPPAPARFAPACRPCAAPLEAARFALERRAEQATNGSRLPIVSGQVTLDQELYADHHRDPHGRRPAALTPANVVTSAPAPAGPSLFPGVHDAPLGHDHAHPGQFSC